MSKISLLLLFTTVTQSALALDRPDSCAPLTTIGADLATLRLGEDMARYGYRRSAQVIFDELLAILAGRSGHKHHTGVKYADFGAEHAKNLSSTGFLLGNVPTLDVMALLNTTLDVSAVSQLTSALLRKINAHIFLAIKRAQGDDSEASKAAVSKVWSLVQSEVLDVVGLFIAAGVSNPPQILSKEDEFVLECVAAKVKSNINAAFAAILEGIYLLVEALPNLRTNDDVKKYSSKMLALRGKAVHHFDLEVTEKYSALRNRVINDFLKRTGTVTGLFALQSRSDDYTTV